jgi:pimeloyl-ACP methyl ester carboxylesterase
MHPLVFLPGAGGRASFWQPVVDRLGDFGPTQLMAWPGFGDVPADSTIESLDGLYRWMLRRLPTTSIHLIAQSMGGVLAARLAIEQPQRVATLVLCATSGGVDVRGLGGSDWRAGFRAQLPNVPDWFERDLTDLTARLGASEASTLILTGDEDTICPPAVGCFLRERIPRSRHEIVRGSGHDFALKRPEDLAEIIRSDVLAELCLIPCPR